jgi:putative sulfotransferase
MLSNIISLYPGLVSISELYSMITDLGTLIPATFPGEKITGSEFWKILSHIYPKQNTMLKHEVEMKEVLYPLENSSPYNRETGVPAVLQTVLPHLSEKHLTLFRELESFFTSREKQPARNHYLDLFKWFRGKFGARGAVERSGGTLRIVHRLKDYFPGARFVHLVRDGRNCALSMEKHYGFRMVMLSFQLIEILGIDPYEDEDREFLSDLPDELVHFLPESFDAEKFKEYKVSPSLYGHYWSGELMEAFKTLDRIPRAQLLTLKYEDILENPREEIGKLIRFLDQKADINNGWLERATEVVGTPSSRWETLPEQERERLRSACEPGFALLQERGIEYKIWKKST